MNRNVEIKARLTDFQGTQALVERLADGECRVLNQLDTFFACPSARLKLRVLDDGIGNLIYYQRPDTTDAKTSHYMIYETDKPGDLLPILTAAFGATGQVRKTRLLYMMGQTRVHLDRVDGLGDFIELEVVLTCDQTEEEGRRIAEGIVRLLGISAEDMVGRAYVDLGTPCSGKQTPNTGGLR